MTKSMILYLNPEPAPGLPGRARMQPSQCELTGFQGSSWLWGFPGGTVVRIPLLMQEMQETWVRPLGQEDPLEESMETHSSILA